MATILIADDSPLHLKEWSEALEDFNYEVFTAADGLEAYELWRNQSFDGLVTDLNMPELNGFELIRQIRNRPGGTKIPIIVTTVRKKRSDVRQAIKYGANDYIVKSRDEVQKLVDKLSKQLDQVETS